MAMLVTGAPGDAGGSRGGAQGDSAAWRPVSIASKFPTSRVWTRLGVIVLTGMRYVRPVASGRVRSHRVWPATPESRVGARPPNGATHRPQRFTTSSRGRNSMVIRRAGSPSAPVVTVSSMPHCTISNPFQPPTAAYSSRRSRFPIEHLLILYDAIRQLCCHAIIQPRPM